MEIKKEETENINQSNWKLDADNDYSHLTHEHLSYPVIHHVVQNIRKEQQKKAEEEVFSDRQRAATTSRVIQQTPTYRSLLLSPGSFRRDYLGLPISNKENLLSVLLGRARTVTLDMLNTNMEGAFLTLGHEELDSDSESEEEDSNLLKLERGNIQSPMGLRHDGDLNREPFLHVRSREHSQVKRGLTVWSGTITLVKSHVGTYLLYLPYMFQEGGLVFSLIILALTAVLSLANMLLLLDCCEKKKGDTYGIIAKTAFGPLAKLAVETSIAVSQMGYCVAYFTYVGQNLQTFFPQFSILQMMAFQLVLYIPLVSLRHLRYFSPFVLVANLCLFSGLVGVFYSVSKEIVISGTQPVQLLNADTMFIFVGSVAISFEGTVLVIPTYEAMENKSHYRPMIKGIAVGLFVSYASFAALGYLAYGSGIERFITLNIPSDTRVGAVIKAGFIVSIMVMFPLMMFPVNRLFERLIFGEKKVHSKKRTLFQKWRRLIIRSCFRALLVGLVFGAAITLIDYYDHFNAVVGAICVCPLSLFYPAMFHLKFFQAENSTAKNMILIGIIMYGLVAMSSSLFVTINTWNSSKS